MADRPWNWPDQRHWKLGAVIGHDPKSDQAAIGWAALALGGPEDAGEIKFDEPVTPERAAMEAVLLWRQRVVGIAYEDWPPVWIYRYSKTSWPRSVAAAEGGTHEDHEKLVRAVAKALRDEGFHVYFKRV